MQTARASRRPVSTRHAFALAFDLALLRDPLHSIVVPFLLRAPWIVAVAILPAPQPGEARTLAIYVLWCVASVGEAVVSWAVDAMLRFRARSVYNTPHDVRPAPVLACYERGFARLPWLYATEFVRNLVLLFAFPMLVVPGIWLGYRLAFATEAVVLDDHTTVSAFRHSYGLSKGRFERWLEMVTGSVLMVLGLWFLAALVYAVPRQAPPLRWVLGGFSLALFALLPIFQYAWTFFYLRLTELEHAAPWPTPEPSGHREPPAEAALQSRGIDPASEVPTRA